jgi:hypothetical protein
VSDEEILEIVKQVDDFKIISKYKINRLALITFARLIQQKQREIDAALCLSAPVKTARQDMRDACANAIRSQK